MIMIVIFSGSLLGRSNMLMLVFSMMAGPFVVNGWITYSMLKRTVARTGRAGTRDGRRADHRRARR